MSDIVEQLENATRRAEYWKLEHVAANAEIESLRQQLADTETLLNEMRDEASTYRVQANNLEQQLAECQAQIECFEPVEFNALKHQWQREALLEAASICRDHHGTASSAAKVFEKMAKELE